MKIFVGYDPQEAAAYHVFCQSVIEHASIPVSFHPLHRGLLQGFDGKREGSNAFIYSRFLVPSLCQFSGWALYCDGDMAVTDDIARLWALKDELLVDTAAAVVKHDYQTKHSRKYAGTAMESKNESYPRKNWSSVILWNCGHFANQALTREFIEGAAGSYLHRFSWLKDSQIAELPHGWNHLVDEDPPNPASLYHYTLGVPGIKHYATVFASWHWHGALIRAMECGDSPQMTLARAQLMVGEPRCPEKAA